jgi:hypothetical protein
VKLETIALIGIAAYAGYHVAKRRAAAKPVPALPPEPPTVVERVYVEEYPVYGYGWGWGPGPWWGGGGRRHHHHHHRGGGGRGGGRGGRR